ASSPSQDCFDSAWPCRTTKSCISPSCPSDATDLTKGHIGLTNGFQYVDVPRPSCPLEDRVDEPATATQTGCHGQVHTRLLRARPGPEGSAAAAWPVRHRTKLACTDRGGDAETGYRDLDVQG